MASLAIACQRDTRPIVLQAASAPAPPSQMAVVGSAVLDVDPDCADVAIAMMAEAVKGERAQLDVRERLALLQGKLTALGVATADLKLGQMRLEPVIEYNTRGDIISQRMRATIRLTAVTRDFSKLEGIALASAEARAATVTTSFRSEQLDEVKRKVRDMALQAAKSKAQQTADNLGFALGSVVAVTESVDGALWAGEYSAVGNVPNVSGAWATSSPQAGSGLATSVETQRVGLNVVVTYQLPRS